MPLDVDMFFPFPLYLPCFIFSLLCWWYEWRKCLSPEGHQGSAKHQLLSACKGLLQWWGFCLYYLSQMLRLALMPHLLLASAGQRWRGYKLLNADGRGGSRPPEMLQMTIPVTGKIKKTMSHTTPCLPHHCPPQWGCRCGVGGTVWLLRPRDFPALTKWNLATNYWWYLCQVPHTRCVLCSEDPPERTAGSQGVNGVKLVGRIYLLYGGLLMWWRQGCHVNDSLCCLQIRPHHPSPVCHLFCIPEDLCWALTLVLA